MHIHDVPDRFCSELEQIRLQQCDLDRSSPHWVVTYEGNGKTLQASVSFFGPQGLQLVRAEDGLAAELAVLITRNDIPRSIAAWRKIMIDSPLFKPAGGGFNTPLGPLCGCISIGTTSEISNEHLMKRELVIVQMEH